MESKTVLVVLPKSHSSPELWMQLVQRQKDFRLMSLKLSPEAFGSTYAREAEFDMERWESRLANPRATIFIAVDADIVPTSPDDVVRLATTTDWQACAVGVGPFNPEEVEKVYNDSQITDFKGSPPRPGGAIPLQYWINAMYVLPSARGKGLGVKVVEFAKAHIAEHCRKAEQQNVRFALLVDYENLSARAVYKKCGFEVVHRYWFNNQRSGVPTRTEAAVMEFDVVLQEAGTQTP